jgi:hypothetical protein
MQKEYFTTSLEHILAELERIDLLIRFQLTQAYQIHQFDDGFNDVVIPMQILDRYPSLSVNQDCQTTEAVLPSQNIIRNAFDEITGDIWLQKVESKRRGIRLRLDELETAFELNRLELDIFLLCLAPEYDLLYERVYAYLQNDVAKIRPSADFVSGVLYPWNSAKLDAAKYVDAEAPLCKHFLLQFIDEPLPPKRPLKDTCLRVDERIANHLLELEIIDPYLRRHVRRADGKSGLESTKLPADLKHRLAIIARDEKILQQAPVFYFQGPNGTGKQATAQALCKELGLSLLIIDLRSMIGDDRSKFEKALRKIRREAQLQHAALYWQGFDLLLVEDKHADLKALLLELQGRCGLTFLSGVKTRAPVEAINNFPFMRIEFSYPYHNEPFNRGTISIDKNCHPALNPSLDESADAFHFSDQKIMRVAAAAGHR